MKKPRDTRSAPSHAVYVTPHALARYRERIDPGATFRGAIDAILAAHRTARRLESQPRDCALYAVHGDAWRIVVRSAPGRSPAVITVLYASQMNDDPTFDPGPSDADLARSTIESAKNLETATVDEKPRAALDGAASHATPTAPTDRSSVDRADRGRCAVPHAGVTASFRTHLETMARQLAASRDKHRNRGDRENEEKRRAWDLLLRCALHVPDELRAAIDAMVPVRYAPHRSEETENVETDVRAGNDAGAASHHVAADGREPTAK